MFLSTLKEAFRRVIQRPSIFFWALLPEGIMTAGLQIFEKSLEDRRMLAVVIGIPLILLCSSISGVLCYLALDPKKRNPGVGDIYRRLWSRFPHLLFLTTLTGLIFLMGFAALIIPGLIFMARYCFAQFQLYRDPKQRKFWDVGLFLFRSSRLVRGNQWTTIAIIATTFFFEMISYLVSETLGVFLGGIFTADAAREAVSLSLEVSFAMALGALCNTWLAVYFLTLESEK